MSALPPKMTWDEIKANHRDDIKRQAIMFYRSRNVFECEPRKLRWELCVKLIVDTWSMLGPQRDHMPSLKIFVSPGGIAEAWPV